MPTPEPKSRLLHLSPDRFVLSLLLGVCVLWLSDRFQWFGFNHHKGWTVLIAVAAVGVAFIVMLLWWAAGLIFRWRFQFGIRSLLAFCVACSIAVGWLAVERNRARRQAEVVEWIGTIGGWSQYDWEVDADYDPIKNPESPGPGWLLKTLGVDFFSVVVESGLYGSSITDAGLEQLKELSQLHWLNLNGTKITDAGLEQLKELSQLHWLTLNGTKITDAGLEHLKGLTQLHNLWLDNTGVTDTGLEHLTELTQLQWLDLASTRLTDAGLEHLKGLTQLQWLDLASTQVTDAGLDRLKGLTGLQSLALSGTHVTDAGLEHLKGIDPTPIAGPRRTQMTDAGLDISKD